MSVAHRMACCIRDLSDVFILVLLYLSNVYYWSGTQCPSTDRMDGKTVIITGSNTGIGKYTAIELARRGNGLSRRITDRDIRSRLGAHVILACRDRSRAEEALKDVCKLSGSNRVEIELVDLASLRSVRDCAKRLRDRLTKLDVLINNAGESIVRPGIPSVADRMNEYTMCSLSRGNDGARKVGRWLRNSLCCQSSGTFPSDQSSSRLAEESSIRSHNQSLIDQSSMYAGASLESETPQLATSSFKLSNQLE